MTMPYEEETASEHIRNAQSLLHILTTYEMSSAQVVQHEETIKALRVRLDKALAIVEGRK